MRGRPYAGTSSKFETQKRQQATALKTVRASHILRTKSRRTQGLLSPARRTNWEDFSPRHRAISEPGGGRAAAWEYRRPGRPSPPALASTYYSSLWYSACQETGSLFFSVGLRPFPQRRGWHATGIFTNRCPVPSGAGRRGTGKGLPALGGYRLGQLKQVIRGHLCDRT
jgi:hypothetical protein